SLSKDQKFAVLNNHSFPPGTPPPITNSFIYDDSGEGSVPGARKTDGPGSLRDFMGEPGAGVWLLTEVDNALTHTGGVQAVNLKIEPQNITNGIAITVEPNSFYFDFVDVPIGATNLTMCISGNTLPMDLFIRRAGFPTQTLFDKAKTVDPPGGCLFLGKTDIPPLNPGRYFIAVFNPNGVAQTVTLLVHIDLDLTAVTPINFSSTLPMPLLD